MFSKKYDFYSLTHTPLQTSREEIIYDARKKVEERQSEIRYLLEKISKDNYDFIYGTIRQLMFVKIPLCLMVKIVECAQKYSQEFQIAEEDAWGMINQTFQTFDLKNEEEYEREVPFEESFLYVSQVMRHLRESSNRIKINVSKDMEKEKQYLENVKVLTEKNFILVMDDFSIEEQVKQTGKVRMILRLDVSRDSSSKTLFFFEPGKSNKRKVLAHFYINEDSIGYHRERNDYFNLELIDIPIFITLFRDTLRELIQHARIDVSQDDDAQWLLTIESDF